MSTLNPNQTQILKTQNIQNTKPSTYHKKAIIRINDREAPVLSVVVDHDGVDNIVYEIVPMIVNGEKIYLFERKRGKVKTTSPGVIGALFNLEKIAFFVDDGEKCSNSMDHCVIFNTPTLFKGKIKDVIVLPKGLRIRVDDEERCKWCAGEDVKFSELEHFMEMIGYDNNSYMVFAVAEGVDVIYIFDYVFEVPPSVRIDNLDIKDMEELQGHLMMKRIENAELSINVTSWYFRKAYIKIYNHEITFENNYGDPVFPITIFIPASALGDRGVVYIIINSTSEPMRMMVRSSEHGETSRVIEPNTTIILYHPRPSSFGLD